MSELVPPFDIARDHWRGGEGVVILEYGDVVDEIAFIVEAP